MNAWKNRRGIVVLGVALLVLTAAGAGRTEMQRLAPQEFQPLKRPAAVFEHDWHNQLAGIEDCSVCHHMYDQNGEKIQGQSSVGVPCAECHGQKPRPGGPGLRAAYHGQCKGCHLDRKAGPVTCAGCHVREDAD